MLIQSNFRDYYDSAAGLGVDKSIVYRRIPGIYNLSVEERSDLNLVIKEFVDNMDKTTRSWIHQDWQRSYGIRHGSLSAKFGILGFCGKLYPYFYSNNLYTTNIPNIKHVYKTRLYQPYNFERSWADLEFDLYQYSKEVFIGPDLTRWFYKLSSPIFTYMSGDDVIRYNIELRPIHFFTSVNTSTAFQELSMYVGGVLPQQGNKTVEITDDLMLLKKHGMGNRSFRQGSPGDKKARRKENKLRKRSKKQNARIRTKGKNNPKA